MNRLQNLKRIANRIKIATCPTKPFSRGNKDGVNQFELPTNLFGSSPVEIIKDSYQL